MSVSSNNSNNQGTRGRCSAPSLLLLCLLVILQHDELVHGEPSQQQQQQQRGNGQSNELGQDFSSGGSGLADGLATLNGYGRGAYTNAKRARGKMSAFMPMRGRKDGRDLVGVDSLRGVGVSPAAALYQQQHQRQLMLPDQSGVIAAVGQPPFVRELEPTDDASLARLISGGGFGASLVAASLGEPAGGNYQRYYLRDNATPRQFYTQFQAASAQQQQQQQEQLGDEARREPDQRAAAGQSIRPTGSGSGPALRLVGLEQAEPVASSANQIMQAKLRRAFHPMRGKKSLFDQWNLFEAAES